MKRVAAAVFAVALGFTLTSQAWISCAVGHIETIQLEAPQVFDKNFPGWDKIMSKGLANKFNRRALDNEIFVPVTIELDMLTWRTVFEDFDCGPTASEELIASMIAEEEAKAKERAIQEEAKNIENAYGIQIEGWRTDWFGQNKTQLAKGGIFVKDAVGTNQPAIPDGFDNKQINNHQPPFMQVTVGDSQIRLGGNSSGNNFGFGRQTSRR